MTDPARHLARAGEEYERVREEIQDAGGEAAVRATAGAYRNFLRLLDNHEESATGSGFQEYIEFQEAAANHVESLDESIPAYEAFEAADDTVHQRRLSKSDFEQAREDLDPAREYADLLVEWEAAQELLAEARADVHRRLRELDDRIDHLDYLVSLADVDLDAPVDRIRDPIQDYNAAVKEAFEAFKRESSARDVLDVVEATDAYPLVDYRQPPTRMAAYLREHDVGEESIPTLLEYADYSAEKLSHYVDNPGDLKRHVATNRTYLTELDASPLQVPYPPPDAAGLRYQTEEYESICSRFAPEEVLAALRDVRRLPQTTEFARLRRVAEVQEELTDDERAKVKNGDVEAELQAARDERERLRATLEAAPEP